MASLLLNKALSIIETNVHGLAVWVHVPTTDFHDFAALLIGFLDRMAIDHLQRHASELVAAVVWGFRAIQLGREGSTHPIGHLQCLAVDFENRIFRMV